MKSLPIGISNFAQVIEEDYYYVDKSLFVKEVIESKVAVTLIPRPRRFGKTLNLSLLRYFFDKTEAKAHLFNDLKVSQYPEIMKHQGKYPVVFLTFKDVKSLDWEDCYREMEILIANEYRRHKYLLNGNLLDSIQKRDYKDIIAGRADKTIFKNSIKDLTAYLSDHHKIKPIVLIDEYDTPIQAGFINNYYEKIIDFMRGFLGAGLKDNDNLQLSVITGILRIAKESIFSGLNNLKVCTFISDSYSDKFGLLEYEVTNLLSDYKLTHNLDAVRSWYNGYQSGEHAVYNPWSIINFIESKGKFDIYWVNVSSNDLIKELLRQGDEIVKEELELLMSHQPLYKKIQENIVFDSVYANVNALWNFLLFSGYLTFRPQQSNDGSMLSELLIPNKEVEDFFKDTILWWFEQRTAKKYYNYILESLTCGDMETFQKAFSEFVLNNFSFFDVTGKEPERVYHSFVLGMLVSLSAEYEIKSNRESGFGRYDVMVIPKDTSKLGIIIEFKKADDQAIEVAAVQALEQIKNKRYACELESRGIKSILSLGIAFEGKKVCIKSEQIG